MLLQHFICMLLPLQARGSVAYMHTHIHRSCSSPSLRRTIEAKKFRIYYGAIFSTICSEPQLYRLKNFYSLYVHMPVLLGFSIATVMCTQMYISPCPDPPFDSRQEYHLIPSA